MMTPEPQPPADASLRIEGATARGAGVWHATTIDQVETALTRAAWPSQGPILFDMSAVTGLDTAGAWLLYRTKTGLEQAGRAVSVTGLAPPAQALLGLVARGGPPKMARQPEQPGALEGLGRTTAHRASENVDFLAFLGETAVAGVPFLVKPFRFRWKQVVVELSEAGHRALPIVGILAFLLGVVIAYQGGVQLRQYGANIFIVDLVGLSMVRELAPMMTAIIVAGRTGSAYAAQIGTMKVTEEVDALRTIGIAPMDQLVLPKVLGLLIALPLLTVYADIMGVLGGMVMSSAMLGISATTYIDRLSIAVSVDSYVIGIGKAPVFAVIIALVGCYQGFRVDGSAESVGRRTTVSVVQAILLVITVDAAFSVAFSWLGI